MMRKVAIVAFAALVFSVFGFNAATFTGLFSKEDVRAACETAGGVLVSAPGRQVVCLRAERIKKP